jgi:predicted RND superfamily exporter protein
VDVPDAAIDLRRQKEFFMLNRLATRWAGIVYRFPGTILIVSLTLAAIGGFLTSKIGIRSNFAELLPDNSPAVADLKKINARVGGMGELIVSVSGKNLPAMERFADDLVAKLRTYPKKDILFIDYKIDVQKAFFERNKYLYLSMDEILKVHDRIDAKIKKEKAKANPFLISLSDDTDEEKDDFDVEAEKQKLEKKLEKFDQYIDGYLTNKDGTELIIVIKTPGDATGVDFACYFVDKVEKEIAGLKPFSYDKNLDVNLTGGLKTLPEEYSALKDDILIVSNLCVFFVLLATALYYRSIRTTLILSTGLLTGILVTFGLTYLRIGYLTAATAFLASIVAGNGINFGIYYLARYSEERKSGLNVEQALARALTGTVLSVSTAALAAGISYASLMAANFKGFNHFGFIGGVGMVVCLLFALTLDPALCVLVERRFPIRAKDNERGRIFSGAAAWLVERHATLVAVIGMLLILGAAIVVPIYLKDPFEYNYRKLRNQTSREQSGKRSSAADKILGERSSPHTILASSFDEVPKIKAALEKFTSVNPDPEKRVIKNIKTLHDYLPGSTVDQEKKIELLLDIRRMITKYEFKSLSEKDKKTLSEMTPPEDLKVITIDEIPSELVRPFVELNGTRGTLVLVYMADGMSVWNGRDMKRFADVVREVKLEDGTSVRSSGQAVIYSDMIDFVSKEGPTSALFAFLLVFVMVSAVYRKPRRIAVITGSMIAGVLLMMGGAVLFGVKLNFLNYIAIPIQFGIGVDYSVNVYGRYLEEGPGSMARVLRSTGGAVMMSCATTIIGYSAMWFSINGAINTFATLANIGEVACLMIAVIIMPSLLHLFDRKR